MGAMTKKNVFNKENTKLPTKKLVDDDDLLLQYGLLTEGLKLYFSSRIWTCREPEFRLR